MHDNHIWFIGFYQQASTSLESTQLDGGGNFVWMLLQTLFALAVVCGLIYLIFRWILPRFGVPGHSASGLVSILDSIGIEPRRNLYVIKVANRSILIATSEAGVQFISDLDTTLVEDELEQVKIREANKLQQKKESFSHIVSNILKFKK
jgi:flagellar biogenesis protein FliO